MPTKAYAATHTQAQRSALALSIPAPRSEFARLTFRLSNQVKRRGRSYRKGGSQRISNAQGFSRNRQRWNEFCRL